MIFVIWLSLKAGRNLVATTSIIIKIIIIIILVLLQACRSLEFPAKFRRKTFGILKTTPWWG